MRQRGPASAAAKATPVVIAGGFGKRPEPPAELTPRQVEIWHAVTSSEPADFFDTDALRGLLADYCRHREAAEKLSGMVDNFGSKWIKTDEGLKRYAQLLRLRQVETRASMTLARSMRLTNQSRYVPHAASRAARDAAKGAKPWEA